MTKSQQQLSSNYNESRALAREIIETFTSGFKDCITSTAEKLVAFLDSPLGNVEILIEMSGGWFNRHVVSNLEKVGRGQMLAQLTYQSGPGYDKLKKLPISLQKKYIDDPVEVLVIGGGNPDVLMIDVGNLTSQQASQVFNGDSVRDIPAQRAWLEDQRTKVALEEKPPQMPYRIKGKKVIFPAGFEATAKEIAMILAELQS